jgi:putative lipoprotein
MQFTALAIGVILACVQQDGGMSSTAESATGDSVSRAETLEVESLPSVDGAEFAGYSYGCADEYRFVAQIPEGGDFVRLLLPDTTVTLPHVVSASGARFSDGMFTYWSNDDEALLDMPGRSFTGCISDEGGPGWRNAKARGVRFRAVGQEPGWILDVQADGRIDVEADYGESVYHFPPVEPEVDAGAGRTVHRIQTEAHRATIVIEDEPCRDSMSGWPYEATVTFTLDGREYLGCGRWL